MNTQVFWNVIGNYNENTKYIQTALLIFLVSALFISYRGRIRWMAKSALGIINLYIGIVFFGIYGTQPIQKFFALPLYVLCGILFLYECIHSKEDVIRKPSLWQGVLIILYILYPLVSIALGNHFPQMVTYIMPCPVISLSIAVYSCYERKNKLLLVLLTIWGLTGVKSVIFDAYEDIILLLCGIYGIFLIRKEMKSKAV